jgi:tRNA-specific 2-thiouridylase
LCNQHLKFGDLVARMELMGADRLATGHYARVHPQEDGSFGLYRAADPAKDQSYALALIPYASLARVEFPLGGLHKREVRAHGERLGLRVWDKPESQDLCFVPDGDYAGFMERRLGETRGVGAGAFVDAGGLRLGTHRGIIHYTVGQRRGLGLSAPDPLYVLAINAAANEVVVGPRAALEVSGLVTGRANWLMPAPPRAGLAVEVKIRSHHAAAAARLHPLEDGRVEVRFEVPQAAVTPGQLAVFYAGERVLGGAAIERALPGAFPAGPRAGSALGSDAGPGRVPIAS